MKQTKQFKLYYFQEQFQQPNSFVQPVTGLGVECITTNMEIGITLSQNYKAGQVMLMKYHEISDDEFKGILTQYLTEEEQNKYIFERSEELFDQFDIFKHLVKEQYLAILPRGFFIQYVKQERIEKIALNDCLEVIEKYLQEFLGLDKNETNFHKARILHNIKNQIDGELPQLENELKLKQFQSMEERVEYENEMKLYTGQGLFDIPKFNKELIHYDWDNMQQIPKQLLQQQ